MREVKRGFVQADPKEFGEKWKERMAAAAMEICYLLDRGYDMKPASTFVGNHYLLSERQRLALCRSLTAQEKKNNRREKEILEGDLSKTVYVDGFNAIITLEVALSGSLLVKGMDGCIRDLAGLRGTYRIVDKTMEAVKLLLKSLKGVGAEEIIIYLDRPVSNSGRLKALLIETGEALHINLQAVLLNDVDRQLYHKAQVITSDAIILDQCQSWYNINRKIINTHIPDAWIYDLDIPHIQSQPGKKFS